MKTPHRLNLCITLAKTILGIPRNGNDFLSISIEMVRMPDHWFRYWMQQTLQLAAPSHPDPEDTKTCRQHATRIFDTVRHIEELAPLLPNGRREVNAMIHRTLDVALSWASLSSDENWEQGKNDATGNRTSSMDSKNA